MRTVGYVDGHNLYFSCLKGTGYKWLDLEALVTRILLSEAPGSQLVGIKYFTSPIKGGFSSRGQASTDAQSEYLRALRTNPKIFITEGRFSIDGAYALRHQVPPDRDDKVRVWRIEEKETDVSIALAMYHDARCGLIDQAVLISNDSDMVPALKRMREETAVKIGVVLPLRIDGRSQSNGRRPSAGLASQADWIRSHVHSWELSASQLPRCVITKRKVARRPPHW
ncbi:NYN domain-containing protein [Luteibacter aegosomaticola]|uniref:NYN domain-containing protein n=1 Tax=Luteibacter aegosomaticola TaxID=2911538 RepID=UPI001FF894DA|nr:NYN domain-containing protein [Luteibacter aegosomaticola]UPG90025.1 NYN domain-containing protein [Luteibacter aegosomaticola]